jgi:GH25 family lysozyme M1 (1,4-beta-N-acetylmuramidase)
MLLAEDSGHSDPTLKDNINNSTSTRTRNITYHDIDLAARKAGVD